MIFNINLYGFILLTAPVFYCHLINGIRRNCGPMGENDAVMSDPGYGQQTLTRYYYDSSIHKCLAFLFLGDGGDGNNYESLQSCQKNCIEMIDGHLSCPGSGQPCKPTKNSKLFNKFCRWGEVCIPHLNQTFDQKGAESGRCCIRSVNAEYNEAQVASCGPEQQYENSGETRRIGRSCETMPCDVETETCYVVNEKFVTCCTTYPRLI